MSAEPKNPIKLSGPEATKLNDDSWKIARIWITNGGGSHVWISAWALDEARSFGHLMADTIRHGAKAYATTYGIDEHQALQDIVDGVGEELREQFSSITMISPGSLDS